LLHPVRRLPAKLLDSLSSYIRKMPLLSGIF
jgi:hypothetical protein